MKFKRGFIWKSLTPTQVSFENLCIISKLTKSSYVLIYCPSFGIICITNWYEMALYMVRFDKIFNWEPFPQPADIITHQMHFNINSVKYNNKDDHGNINIRICKSFIAYFSIVIIKVLSLVIILDSGGMFLLGTNSIHII